MRILENAYVNSVLSQFETSDPALDKSIGERTGTIDLSVPSGIEYVVTIDGGEMVVPNPVRRDRAVGFVNVATTLLRMRDLEKMRSDLWIDPRDMAQLLTNAVWSKPAVIPLAGVRIPGQTVKQTIRQAIDQTLDYAGLYPTLNFLVSRLWEPGYAMPSSGSPAMDCRRCGQEFFLPRDMRVFQCPDCQERHTLADYLGIAADSPDSWVRADAATQLRDVLETLSLFHFIALWHTKPERLAKVLFLKDGPLLLRANLSRLVEPIRALIEFLKTKSINLNVVGIEKNGDLVDHIPLVEHHLPNIGDYFIPSVSYLLTEIAGSEMPPNYRNRVSYGAKVVARIGQQHVLALNMPTGDFLLTPSPADILGLECILRTLPHLVSYRYPNALLPVVAANSAASLSVRPSAQILEQFTREVLGS